MVLTHTTNHAYTHPFPTVTLAYFLRYCSPQVNPFANHVLSTDTLSSYVDANTGRLHTTRIHLKKSRLPNAVFILLPTSMTGGMTDKATYILETSVVDMHEGWMRTESRNLNYTGVLSVVERQLYTAPSASPTTGPTAGPTTTGVETTVIFRSRLGERIRERIGQGGQQQARQAQQQHPAEGQQNQAEGQQQNQAEDQQHRPTGAGWFGRNFITGLGTRGIQRSIENIASTKTQDQLGKSREGMHFVLERLRKNGLMGVLELRRRAIDGRLDV